MPQFCHLHVHSQYSLLDGAAGIDDMVKKAKGDGMRAMALTDHGNMFGAFQFYKAAEQIGIQPILGCEFYVVEDMYKRSFTMGSRDVRFHQLLLAKNEEGYRNLSRLCSMGYIDGMYGKYPRVDRNLIRNHSAGLIATTCCIGAEVPQAILHKGEEEAERIFLEWREIFGDDYIIELQRHQLRNIDGTGMSQEDVNQVLLKWARKYNVPVIATNDSHYVEREDYQAHDTLLCINTGEFKSKPIGEGKDFRFGFANDEFYFKTQDEMSALFSDLPEAVENTVMLLDRIETPKLKRDLLMPNYILPEGFSNQADYLRHITFEGARKRYGNMLPAEVVERIEFELNTIIENQFEGYFLIVQDFTTAAREMDVWVGPGRGSAAGSVVAYCLGIINVDPVKYDLLFERFLNPERVSMPDIDIDFEDAGRDKVLEYVAKKYGERQIAQIITYGTMAAKSSIRDVGRVLQLTPKETDKLSKMVPNGLSLDEIFTKNIKQIEEKHENLRPEEVENVRQLQDLYKGTDLTAETLKTAQQLEGSVRNTGVHACGVIIAPDDLTQYIPVATSKESPYYLAQFDVNLIEESGLLKMDFLGLRTLTILKDALKLIHERHGISIDLDTLPLDDKKTFELFQRGETNGTFQFESPGMQKYLKELKPTRLEDLIAMNALYRPGPMKYIPEFIQRKHGKKKITYDLPAQEELLRETYGITVYQEQVMLLSQRLAGFSKGKADELRKAMGKKKREVIDKLKPEFMEGCSKNNHDLTQCEKIWTDWEEFASYAFNKSHSTCYAVLAYQTAYLKAHYPAEYMAAVLANNMGDIKKVTFFMDECRRMGLKVLGPDINESRIQFRVNAKGEIRFGLGAIKGVGEAALEQLITEREAHGPYENIFDLTARINLKAVNRKTLEALALAGCFDFDNRYHRRQYVEGDAKGKSGIEMAIEHGNRVQQEKLSGQTSLFGGDTQFTSAEPKMPTVEKYTLLEELKKECEVVGVYISNHPMDMYRFEWELLRTVDLADLASNAETDNYEFAVVGIVSSRQELLTKRGEPFGKFVLEDYTGQHEFTLFSKDYLRFKALLEKDYFIYLRGNCKRFAAGPDSIVRMNITSIQHITQTNAVFVKSLELDVQQQNVNDNLIDMLRTALQEYPGNTPINLNIVDREEQQRVQLSSSSGVKICAELKAYLDSLLQAPAEITSEEDTNEQELKFRYWFSRN
jgi:DNA polymerase III subunit alpha